jgi:hypothetical protein
MKSRSTTTVLKDTIEKKNVYNLYRIAIKLQYKHMKVLCIVAILSQYIYHHCIHSMSNMYFSFYNHISFWYELRVRFLYRDFVKKKEKVFQ